MKKKIKRINVSYVKRYQKNQRDLEAFNAIYDFYRDYLLYFAYTYIKDMNDAEEVVQETFIKMIYKIHTLKKVESFHAWLYKICYTNVMQYYRTKNRYHQFEDENGDEEVEDVLAKTDQEYTKLQLYEEIHKVIDELEVRFQSVAQLYYFDEMKIKEIAKVLEVPEGTIKSRLNKIRSDLKERLEGSGIRPSSFLSIGFTPFLYAYFQEIIQTVQMDPTHAGRMLGVLHKTTMGITTVSMGTTVSHTIGKKVAISLGVATAGTLIMVYFLPKEPVSIEQIEYHQEITNKTLEIEVLLNTEIKAEEIIITNKEEKLLFNQKNTTVSFHAVNNGVYKIQVRDQIKEINVTNIDKQAPIIEEIKYIEGGIQLETQEEHSINYEKSYIIYQGEQGSITNTNTILGDFKEGIVKVILYDSIGNKSVYDVTVEVEE